MSRIEDCLAGFVRTGHRGARGLAPENTLVSFQRAVELGVDMLELDVRRSRDGEVVVFHDATLERVTDGAGPLAERSYAELAALDAGYRFSPDGGASHPFRGEGARIPRLIDVLQAFPETAITIELKPAGGQEFVEQVVGLVREHAPGRVLLASFEHDLLQAVRRVAPDLPTSFSALEIRNFYLLGKVGLARWSFRRTPARAIQMPRYSDHEHDRGLRLVTPRLLARAHRLGLKVHVWTINEPAVMRELLALGVDGITSDRPDVLNEVLKEQGVHAGDT